MVNPRNDTLEELGGYLSEYAGEYFHNTPVECEVSLQDELPHLTMPAEMRHNLFLAFEEALNNVLKHSGASQVRVEFRVQAGRLDISVSDNGRGFETPPTRRARLARVWKATAWSTWANGSAIWAANAPSRAASVKARP